MVIRYRSSPSFSMLWGGQLAIGSTRVAWSSMSKSRSNPTVDRYRGERSYLIATSSVEQHGHESAGHRPGARPPSPKALASVDLGQARLVSRGRAASMKQNALAPSSR